MSTFYTSVERYGNNILFRGYRDGKAFKMKVPFKPTFYVPSKSPTPYKTLQGQFLAPVKMDSMSSAYEFVEQYKDVDNFKIYGTQNYCHQAISDLYYNKPVEWDRKAINVTSVDIEVQSDEGFPDPQYANYPITAITCRSSIDDIYYTWACVEYNVEDTINKDLKIQYVRCKDEKDLLVKFLTHWIGRYPDVVTGWNSRLFDTVYLVNRMSSIISEEAARKISPWHVVKSNSIEIAGKQHQVYDIYGIQQLDYLDLFKKFAYKYGTQESYKLNNIAHTVLNEQKLDYSEYSSLNELYKKNPQKFIDYNIKDVSLVDRMDDKLGLISLCMTIAYKGLVNMSEAFGPVNLWDALIYNELRRNNIICPPRESKQKLRQIQGAFVKDPILGMHSWIVSFDVASLYPHIMMQYNMSPEMIVDNVYPDVTVEQLLNEVPLQIKSNYCISATGQYFKTDGIGFIPRLVQSLYNERNVVKKEMLKIEQDLEQAKTSQEKTYYEKEAVKRYNQEQAIKILMNSLYGAMSNEFFRYYDMRIAESITVTGQLTIQWAEKRINKYFNEVLGTSNIDYVIAIDTDSLYINFGPLVKKLYTGNNDSASIIHYIDDYCKTTIQPILEKGYVELKQYLNAPVQKISMKREIIADKGIWTGKKHYIVNVYNSEGVQYQEPKLKIKGIEAVRSSTPMACRDSIKKALSVIMTKDEQHLQAYVKQFHDKFLALPFNAVAFPRSVRGLKEYRDSSTLYKKGTPIHVKGALLYNVLRDKYDMRSIAPINDGDKIKFCYLKVPNPIGDSVIAAPEYLPPEFNLDKYLDREMQFAKSFLEPLRTITDAINWSVEPRATLEAFF